MRVRKLSFVAGAGAAVATLVVGCANAPVGPRSYVYVLVDLSETWFNPGTLDRNEHVLTEVGEGIAQAADLLDPSVLVQYRPIGTKSLERDPLCSVEYARTIVATKTKDAEKISQPKKLHNYLGVDCPQKILAAKPELQTEISAAIASIASVPLRRDEARYVVIASDFLEESPAVAPVAPMALKGTRILLLYRPVTQDQSDPAALAARMKVWRTTLESEGGTVAELPDTGVRRERLVQFLTEAEGV